MKRNYYRIQYRPNKGYGRWETIETTRSESNAMYLYREYVVAYGGQGELRLLKNGEEMV